MSSKTCGSVLEIKRTITCNGPGCLKQGEGIRVSYPDVQLKRLLLEIGFSKG